MATSDRRNPNLRNRFRILVTVEPRSNRETIAAALQSLRPAARIRIAGPAALETEVERFAPHLVICNHATAAVEHRVPAWVELCKEHGSSSVVSVRGWRWAVDGMGLDDLLSVVDKTPRAAGPELPSGRRAFLWRLCCRQHKRLAWSSPEIARNG